jgi:pimeloyl-ACP methyl ester carboxylesterase
MRKHLTLSTHTISYLAGGGDGSRGTVLLLHAFPLNADMWAPQLEALPRGWRLIAPDLGGFGPSRSSPGSPEMPPMLRDHTADVLALLDDLHVERAVIGGLSMGGYVTFAVLRRAPERSRGLVLADTRPQADSPEARTNRTRMLELLDASGPAAVAREMLPRLLGETTRRERPAVGDRITSMITANSAEAIRDAIVWMMARPDSTPLLRQVRCPTLVLVGTEDGITPVDDARQMAGQIPGAELEVIPGAGHLSSFECPDAFNAALARFLSTRFEER